jgi:YidC/Oxa1 family membrane protein insertase
MDRNSAIGLTLIAVLLLVYFNFLAPTPQPEIVQPAQITSPVSEGSKIDSIGQFSKIDSTVILQYGSLSSFLSGNEESITIENNDLRIALSNRGYLKEIQLKNFKTYSQKPLFLASNGNNTFSLVASYEGKDIDLYKLFYQVESSKRADTTLITLSAKMGGSSFIKHIYSIPSAGYQIGYEIQTSGISLSGKNIAYRWNNKVALQEKALEDSRTKTTINYYDFIDYCQTLFFRWRSQDICQS